jgi:hypothetical protein
MSTVSGRRSVGGTSVSYTKGVAGPTITGQVGATEQLQVIAGMRPMSRRAWVSEVSVLSTKNT